MFTPTSVILLFFIVIGQCVCSFSFIRADVDDPRWESDPPKFEHQWNSGDQQYHLAEGWLTEDLFLTRGELAPVSQGIVAQQTAETIRDPHVQLVSNQEEVEADEHQEEVQDEATGDAELEIAANFPVKNIEMLRQEIQVHQETIKADDQISESVRSSRLQILSLANESLQKCLEMDALRERYEAEVNKIEQDKAELKQLLEEQIEPATPVVNETTLSSTLESELKKRQDDLERKKSELEQIESAIQYHSERVIRIPIDRSKAMEKQQALRDSIASIVGDDLDSQISQLSQELELLSLDAELKKLESEERRQEIGAKFDPIRRDLKLRDVKRLEIEIASWEKSAQELRDQEVADDLREAKQKAFRVHWRIEPLAKRNAALIAEQQIVVDRVQSLRTTLEKITRQSEDIVKRRTEIEKKIEAGGLTATNGMLLVDLRRNLMTTGESHIQIRKLQNELRQVNLKNVSLREERDELAVPAAKVRQLIDSQDLDTPLASVAKEYVTTKRKYLDQLLEDRKSYSRLISEVSQARKKLIEEINQTTAYVDKNAIWIRSSEPARLSDFATAQQGLTLFFDADRWHQISKDIGDRMLNRLYESAIAIFSITFLIGANRRFRRRLKETRKS